MGLTGHKINGGIKSTTGDERPEDFEVSYQNFMFLIVLNLQKAGGPVAGVSRRNR